MSASISKKRRAAWFFGLAAAVIAVDQFCKYLALQSLQVGVVKPVLGDLLGLTLARNDSAAFSLGFGVTWFFAITSTLAAVAVIWARRKLETKAWIVLGGLLLGGIVGNLIDRFAQSPYFGSGHVVDFLVIPFRFPIFNVADMAITLTITISMIRYISGYPLGKSKSSVTSVPDSEVAKAQSSNND